MRDTETQIKINAYVNGRLSEKEIEALWFEIAKNPDLLIDLEVEAGVKQILEHKERGQNRNLSAGIPRWTWHAAAAAVIAIVALIQIFRVETPTELHEFVLSEIEVNQFETSDHVRGEEEVASTVDTLLDNAFAAYYSGDSEKSVTILNSITAKYEEEQFVSKAWLNKGIIYFNAGNFDQSIASFQKAIDLSAENSMTYEKANWFLANALANVGKLNESRQAAYVTYNLNGIFKDDAFLLLLKLNGELKQD